MLSITHSGSFSKTESFLKSMSKLNVLSILNKYGMEGVSALSRATPVNSGIAASSWSYQANVSSSGYSITWSNTNVENGFPVAIMLQYGYGTGTGGYVQGRNYINPAIGPIFDKIADEVWRVVTAA